MLSLDQVLSANRPLIFVVAESDLEVLLHLSKYCKDDNLFFYSTTLAGTAPLQEVLDSAFTNKSDSARTTGEVLTEICQYKFPKNNVKFYKYVFLDAQMVVNDPQNVRLIKDILSRYQIDSSFTMSLIFISHTVVVPPALERLSEIVFFDLPSKQKLGNLASSIYKRLRLEPENEEEISLNLKGLTLFEAEQALLQSHNIFQKVELDFIRNFKKNSIAKTDLLSLMELNVTFDQIGGMDRLKAWVKKSAGGWTVEGQKYGLPLMKGVLMIGPPGTGKSLLAKALGNEWKLPVVLFDPSKLFSSRVGESEGNERRALKVIEGIAPCVVMIDEMEKGFSGSQSSTYSDAGVTSKVLGIFLTWFQDCTEPIFIVGTSNNINQMPPELISRFDEIFFVNLPQDFERQEIFRIHLKKVNRDPEKFDLRLLSEKSTDLTGREIEQVIRESLYDSFHAKKELDTEALLSVLSKKTTILMTMSEQLKSLMDWVGYDDTREDGVRARFASSVSSININRVNSEIDRLLKDIEGKKPFKD